MRITLDESKTVGNGRQHMIGMTETFANLDEAVEGVEARLREQGKDNWTVRRYEGTPGYGVAVDVDVHDPPEETNVTIIDADAYESLFGYSAEEAAKFQVKHAAFLEALVLGDPRIAPTFAQHAVGNVTPSKPRWLSNWAAIEKRIRAHDVMRGVIADGDKAKPIRTWNVLVGIEGDARPVMVTEGLEGLTEGSPEFLMDREKPWKLPVNCVQVPWKVLRRAVRDGNKILIDGLAYEDDS